ncbi:YeiH family putative sulfate export transporter [Erwiniaceae bacterium BAC15a-03b]|uniref:YeiH family putative sulfate export transporter n=1 Tax=Winslowiella arboricola TaxID=2978220 RepID=A0A9J6PXM6_9GAMM|nr:YeiH family putative sulfate export transporter [Winslowiella arboricola]MCU5773176.1 YeiH family putative sulfate export transporter [Winslowiella arboricola]MCU5778759.1 YeiH family putative sulfate export transporter [Winslowiella arboricola]
MAELTLPATHRAPGRHLPGLLLAAAIAGTAIWLGNQPAIAALGLGALTLAIVVGMLVGNTVWPRLQPVCDPGILLAKQRLLRLGIVLYGFRLTVQQIADVGLSGVVIDVITLCSTFALACWLGRRVFGLDRQTRWLIGAGSSICGAAAILATEPVIKADSAKVAVAIATVVIFGTLAIFIYPLLYPLVLAWFPAVTPTAYGIYTGSTLHEVAQVVAAGHAISPEAENAAVIAKMLRVMMLAPFLLFLGALMRRGGNIARGAISFPWFALLFIGVALFNSLHLLPPSLLQNINQLDNLLLAMAMAALGLTTHISALKRAGVKPLLMALLLFIWLIVGGGAINLLVQHLMG